MRGSHFSPQRSSFRLSGGNISPSHVQQRQEHNLTPVKYLLQNNIKLNVGKEGHRGEEEISMIASLLKECTVFQNLGIDLEEEGLLKELCKSVVLIYCEGPHIMDIKDNQIFIFFQGQGFEYMQNNFENEYSQRYKIYENNQYIMVHKINTNQYFLSLPQTNSRYHATRKKYQLMVDQNTLLGKISDELFTRVFMPKIMDRQKNMANFLRKVSIFNGLPNSFFGEFSKFLIEENTKAEQKVIAKGQKSKYVYFIKKGQVQVRSYPEIKKSGSTNGPNYYVAPTKQFTVELLKEGGTFGMEQLEVMEVMVDKEVICLKDCQFYKIEKRLLAIIITSFQLEFKQKNKLWSEININNQIKGQNYCTPQQELLVKNANRIKTSQRKARDLKLRFYASKKPSKEQQSQRLSRQNPKQTLMDEQQNTLQNTSRLLSPDEKRRMIQTTDGRFRTTSVNKFVNAFGGLMDEGKYSGLKRQMDSRRFSNEDKIVNNYMLVTLQESNRTMSPLLRRTNAFQYIQKMGSTKSTRSLSKRQKHSASHKFVPRLQSKVNDYRTSGQKYNADMIGFYLDKKIKNEIVKKADKVMTINRHLKLVQNKNIKRLFSSRDGKIINAMSEADKKTVASGIIEQMSNLKNNPLLLEIQNQRRKMERHLKSVEKRQKPITDSPRKYKKEDQHILIRNNVES